MNGCSILTPVDRALKVRTIQAQFPNEFFFQTSDYLINGAKLITPASQLQHFYDLTYRLTNGNEKLLIKGGPSDYMKPEIEAYRRLSGTDITPSLREIITTEAFNLEATNFLIPQSWTWIILDDLLAFMPGIGGRGFIPHEIVEAIGDKIRRLRDFGITSRNVNVQTVVRNNNSINFYLTNFSAAIFDNQPTDQDLIDFDQSFQSVDSYHYHIFNLKKLIPGIPLTVDDKLNQLRQRYPGSEFFLNGSSAYRNCGCFNEETKLEPIAPPHPTFVLGNQIIKGGRLVDRDGPEVFNTEINFNIELSNSGIIPRVIDVLVCEEFKIKSADYMTPQPFGWLISEKMDGSVDDLLKTEKRVEIVKPWITAIRNLLIDLNEKYRISHNDFHLGNVVYQKQPDGSLRLYLIDLGLSTRLAANQDSTDLDILVGLLKNEGLDYNYRTDQLVKI